MDPILRTHLRAAAELAEAGAAALFVPSDDETLELRAAEGLDQPGLDAARFAWNTQRRQLRQGQLARVGNAVIWPLRVRGQLAAIVYLDRAHGGFPEAHEQAQGAVLADRLKALERPSPLGPFIANEVSPEAELRRQLELVLRQVAGNVSAAARLLGVHRDTVYERAARFGISLRAFRPAR